MYPINPNMFNQLQQFQQFYKMMQGKNPRDVLNELLSSGKVTKEQVDQARQMAEQFKGIFTK